MRTSSPSGVVKLSSAAEGVGVQAVPRLLEYVLVRAGAGEVGKEATCGNLHLRTDFEELESARTIIFTSGQLCGCVAQNRLRILSSRRHHRGLMCATSLRATGRRRSHTAEDSNNIYSNHERSVLLDYRVSGHPSHLGLGGVRRGKVSPLRRDRSELD